jgi:hypothetical protein
MFRPSATAASTAASTTERFASRLDGALGRAIEAMIATLFVAVVGAPVALIAFGWLTGALAW